MTAISKLKHRAMARSRGKKLDHFYSLSSEGSNVLDVGVTNNEHNSQVNLFLNTFRYVEEQYTGLAIESLDDIRRKHPNKKFVEYSGGDFPFVDKQFDWVFSNAVIEHVGDSVAQVHFVNEMLRVSKNVFFTTPNKYFPVEAHTNTLFRHWNESRFYEWCMENSPYWTDQNLVLLSYEDLKRILERSVAKNYRIHRNRFLFYPMTFTVVCLS